jgi:hypothetical protein
MNATCPNCGINGTIRETMNGAYEVTHREFCIKRGGHYYVHNCQTEKNLAKAAREAIASVKVNYTTLGKADQPHTHRFVRTHPGCLVCQQTRQELGLA